MRRAVAAWRGPRVAYRQQHKSTRVEKFDSDRGPAAPEFTIDAPRVISAGAGSFFSDTSWIADDQRSFFHPPYLPVLLLIGSNAFMTTAWYWYLRFKEVPLGRSS